MSFYFLVSFLGSRVSTSISGEEIELLVINIIVILAEFLFCGFYISIYGEFIYKLLLKSNAETVVFFDVLIQRRIYLILIQLFQMKIKFSVRICFFVC